MAIQVSGTQVIGNSRELTNIASVDATTAASISAAGVGGSRFAKDFIGVMADGLSANGRMASSSTKTVHQPGYMVTTDGNTWATTTISGFADSQTDIAYHSGTTWVIVGNDSWIWTSNNDLSSITSSYQDTGLIRNMMSVTSNGSTIVAINRDGYFYYSTNATTWTRGSRLNTEVLVNVRYLNGLWIIVGGNRTIFTSTNGTSWTDRSPSGSNLFIYDVAYGNGTYVAVGVDGLYYTSTDGTSWTDRTGIAGTSQSIESIEYAPDNGVFFMCGASGFIGYTDDPTSYVNQSITQRSSTSVWGAYNVHVTSVGGTEKGYVTWSSAGKVVYTE